MIITCHKCSTSYNLNESLLKSEGTKVRCTVCNNIFRAFPPVESIPAAGLEVPDFEPPSPPHAGISDSGMNEKNDSVLSGDNQEESTHDGVIAYLELDEKSLGIEDIINDIIFIPREPEDFEPETVSGKDLLLDDPPAGDTEQKDSPSFFTDSDGEATGELTDLDLGQDDGLDLEDDLEDNLDPAGEPPAMEDIPGEEALSDDMHIPDEADIHIPAQMDELQDIETEFSPDDIGDTGPEFEDLSSPPEPQMDEISIDFGDDSSGFEDEDKEDADNLDFEFEGQDTLEFESAEPSEDEFSEELDFEFDQEDIEEEEEGIDAPDLDEVSREIEPDDEFEFDMDGELTLIDEEVTDDTELSFDDISIEDETDLLTLEDDTSEIKADIEADEDLLQEDTDRIEDGGDIEQIEDGEDTDDKEDGYEINGAFELEFDVDSDLGLNDAGSDPDYLLEDISHEEDEEDALEMLEIESDNDGDAFLEDFSKDALAADADDDKITESEFEPEFFIEDNDKSDESVKPGKEMTHAGIRSPIPPPLPSEHFGRVKTSKRGGSKIVPFFFFIVFLAVVVLIVYGIGVRTQIKIPYISDLKITWLDKYLQPAAPQMEPVKVHPTEQSVSGSFVANENAGTLFVITGKVINDSSIFVSHVTVRGTLIAEGNIRVKEMVVSCGNILTNEQLEKGNLDDLNKILMRPEGENNSNVRIKPYGTVQFMIIFSGLPELLKTFEVEVVEFDRNIPAE